MFGIFAICLGSAVFLTCFLQWRKHVREYDALIIDGNGELTRPMVAVASGVVDEYRQVIIAAQRVGTSLLCTLVAAAVLMMSVIAVNLPEGPFSRVRALDASAISIGAVLLGMLWYLLASQKQESARKQYLSRVKA